MCQAPCPMEDCTGSAQQPGSGSCCDPHFTGETAEALRVRPGPGAQERAEGLEPDELERFLRVRPGVGVPGCNQHAPPGQVLKAPAPRCSRGATAVLAEN